MSNEDHELLNEIKEAFADLKKDSKFKSSFEEVDSIFFIGDFVLSAGFVSSQFSRQVCSKIADNYVNWVNYLHGLALPSPNYMIQMQEHKMLNESDRKEIWKLIGEAMNFVSENSVLTLEKNISMDGKFIDKSVDFWNNSFRPRALKIVQKVHDGWQS